MTRELAFRQSLLDHFCVAGGLTPIQVPDLSALASGDFPAISITLGDTKYSAFDPAGHATQGLQEFTLQLYTLLPQRALETMLHTRSDMIYGVESFLNGSYVPPVVAPGDTYRITGLELLEISTATLNPSATRFTLQIKGRYNFTLL